MLANIGQTIFGDMRSSQYNPVNDHERVDRTKISTKIQEFVMKDQDKKQ